MKIDITKRNDADCIFDFRHNKDAVNLIKEYVRSSNGEDPKLEAMMLIVSEAEVTAGKYSVTIKNEKKPTIKLSYAGDDVYVEATWQLAVVTGFFVMMHYQHSCKVYASNYPRKELPLFKRGLRKPLPIADVENMPIDKSRTIVGEMDYIVAVAKGEPVERKVDVSEQLKELGRRH